MPDFSTLKRPALTGDAAPSWFYLSVTVAVWLGLIRLGGEFLVPLVVAALLFVLALAIAERIMSLTIGRWKPPKWVARLFAVGSVFLGFLALGTVASNQAGAITQAAPHYAERFRALADKATDLVGVGIDSALERAVAGVDIGALLSRALTSVSGALGAVVLVLLYVSFMAAEHGALREKLHRLCADEAGADHLARVLRSISARVQNYMWISALTSASSAVAAFVILKSVGGDFAVTIALVVFVVRFIPSIGSIIAVTAASLVALLQFDTIAPFLVVLVVYGGVDAIIGFVIQPAIQGRALNLSPLMGMVSVAFWGFMWGTIGAFIAVPMTVAIMIVCAEFPLLRPFAVLLSSDGELLNAGGSEGPNDNLIDAGRARAAETFASRIGS